MTRFRRSDRKNKGIPPSRYGYRFMPITRSPVPFANMEQQDQGVAAANANSAGAESAADTETAARSNVTNSDGMAEMCRQFATQMQRELLSAFRQMVVEVQGAQQRIDTQPEAQQFQSLSNNERSAHGVFEPSQSLLVGQPGLVNVQIEASAIPNNANTAEATLPQHMSFQTSTNPQTLFVPGNSPRNVAHTDMRGAANYFGAANYCGLPAAPPLSSMPMIDVGSSVNGAQRHLPSFSNCNSQYTKTIDLPKFAGDPADWPIFERSFIDTTAEFNYSNTRNIIRLRQALCGRAKEAVDSLLPFPESVPEVIAVLKQNFGRPEQIVNRHIADVRKMPNIQYGNYGALISFSNLVRNLAGFIKYAKADYRISDATLITELVGKLPSEIQMQWAEYKESRGTFATVLDLSEFLNILAKRANSVQDSLPCSSQNNPRFSMNNKSNNEMKTAPRKHAFVANVEKPNCLICSGSCTKISSCQSFKNLSIQGRWDKVKEHQLCFGCLKKGHALNKCYSKRKCAVLGCTKHHNSMLHMERELHPNTSQDSVQVYRAKSNQGGNEVLFQILPVVITVGARSLKTFAFIDHGASHSMIEWSLADRLGLKGKSSRLNMQWLGNVTSNEPSQKVDFQIKGCESFCKSYRMNNVYTVRNLNLPEQSVDFEGIKYQNAKPELVVGLDHAHLTTATSTPVMVDSQTPIIAKTSLGFVAYGKTSTVYINDENNAERLFAGISVKRKLQDMELLLNAYFTDDNLGAYPPKEKLMSKDEARAMQMMEKSTKRIEGRYEVSLLWKSDNIMKPDTQEMAIRRLKSLEAKMQRNEEFAEQYYAKMGDYIAKGYARKLGDEELSKLSTKDWYLPHFAVSNPNKKTLRIVFDAAAEVGGQSLNSMLLPGPDLNQSLLSVLFKFRQASVAVCADIKEMFLQVAVNREDQAAQKFLWRTSRSSKQVSTYVMTRMLFGAKCSPTLAQFVKNTNARRHDSCCARAVDGIVNHHYVDDYIDCFNNEDEAIDVIKRIIAIHREGGFELRGFVSNSNRVLESIGSSQPSSSLVAVNCDETERVLGMYWNHALDQFLFVLKFHKVRIEVVQQARKPTKREVLCLIMSLFDPFGLLGNYMITGKLIMQTLWKLGVMWDEPIPDDVYEKWKMWLADIMQISKVQVPRCYHENFLTASKIELHIFADASESAIAAVAYFRIVVAEAITVRLIFSKTRCAPLKYVSIPRLELQAAVVAVRVKQIVADNHDIEISQVYYWTDSATVVNWIRSDSRQYKQYVANRIGEILEHSSTNEWRWLPGTCNVADEGTRANYHHLMTNTRWIDGPEFLKKSESEWPAQSEHLGRVSGQEECKPNKYSFAAKVIDTDVIDLSRFSKFMRLLRTAAWVLRFIQKCRKSNITTTYLSLTELSEAETVIYRQVQRNAFHEEYEALLAKKPISKKSPLLQLNPFIDEKGVVRLLGRIEKAEFMPVNERRLIILPKVHMLTDLVVRHYHERCRHINKAVIITEIRRKYWIPSVRAAVKRCETKCNACQVRKAEPKPPIMGLLPVDRVTPYVRPFSYTGIDYFGPVMVTVARRKEKRWVALFTCLTIRAVHLELAADLSSDACLVCIRNFINRRGVPIQIRSDNGTNFQGINKELKGVEDFMDHGKMTENLAGLGIRWLWNCPANPSAGGAWERLVQSVKKALNIILKEAAPKIETLISALIEAENIVNSRPLTHLPVSSEEDEPLTPNHFLINTANSTQTPGEAGPKQVCTRKQWKIAQNLKNSFWKRWIQEYLPDLCRRSKWCQDSEELKVNDLVLVCDAALPRSVWKRGKILSLCTGADGRHRSAEVKIQNGVVRRPVSKLAKLDIKND